MKWAVVAVVVAVASVVVAFTVVVGASRDVVPERLRACVLDGQAGIALAGADLGAQARSDIGAGAVRERSRTPIGESTAVLLEGTGYRVLVLAGPDSPPLSGDLALRVFERTPEFALVAREVDPVEGVLRDCIALLSGP